MRLIPDDLRINVEMDAKEVEDALERMSGDLEDLPDAVNVRVGLESTGSEHLEEIEEKLDIIDDGATAEITADSTGAKEEIIEVEGDLSGLSDGATVEIDAENLASPEIEEVASSQAELDGSTSTINLEAEGSAPEVLEETKAVAEELDGKTVTLDVTPAQQSISDLDNAIMGVGETMAGIAAGLGIEQMVDMAGSVEDSWKRLELVFRGTGVNVDDLKSRISKLSEETGRSGGSIRETFIKMGLIGITNVKTIEDTFKAMSVAAFVSGKPIDAIAQKFTQLIAMPSIRPKMLADLGITNDVLGKMGYTVDSLREAWKTMTPEQKASILSQAVMLRYGEGAVSEYKDSWAGAREQVDIALNSILRLIGDLILPFVIPALKTVAGALQWVAGVIKGLPDPVKNVAGGFLFVALAGSTVMMALSGISKILSFLMPKWFMNTKLMRGLFGEGGRLSRIGPAIGRGMDRATTMMANGFRSLRNRISGVSWETLNLRNVMQKVRGIPGGVVNGFKRLRDSIAGSTVAQKFYNREQDKGFLATVRNTAATVGATIKNVLLAAATYAVAGAQAVLNAVMSANPIFLIVMAIAALVGVLLYLWRTNKGFRDTVLRVWDSLKGFAGWIWGMLKPVFDWLVNGIKWITGGFKNLGGTITGPLKRALSFLPFIFMGPIGIAFGIAYKLFKGFKWPKLSLPKLPDLPRMFLNLLLNVGRTVYKWFKGFRWPKLPDFNLLGVLKRALDGVKWFMDVLKKLMTNPLKPLFDAIKRLWNDFFKNLLTGFYNWGKNLILNFLKGVVDTFKSAGRKVLSWIKSHFPSSPPKTGPLSEVKYKNMVEWGASLSSGIGEGFSKGMKLPELALPSIKGMGVGMPASPVSGASGGNVGVNVNVEINTGPISGNTDVRVLAREVGAEVSRQIADELIKRGVPPKLYGGNYVRRVVL